MPVEAHVQRVALPFDVALIFDAHARQEIAVLDRDAIIKPRAEAERRERHILIEEAQVENPNGLCFSPEYDRLYVASTGKGPGDTGAGGKGEIFVFDIAPDGAVSNGRLFSDCMVDEVKCGPDGLRCDVFGNLWASSNAGRNVGYSGVTCWAPDGRLLGRVRLPEVCGNICFGGPKRNVLFMAASQSIYALPTATQGAGFS